MQISSEVHNYMETLLGTKLVEMEYTEKYTSDQLADLACLVLNRLPAIYIRHDIDMLAALSDQKLVEMGRIVIDTITDVEHMIANDRRSRAPDELEEYFKVQAAKEAREAALEDEMKLQQSE